MLKGIDWEMNLVEKHPFWVRKEVKIISGFVCCLFLLGYIVRMSFERMVNYDQLVCGKISSLYGLSKSGVPELLI